MGTPPAPPARHRASSRNRSEERPPGSSYFRYRNTPSLYRIDSQQAPVPLPSDPAQPSLLFQEPASLFDAERPQSRASDTPPYDISSAEGTDYSESDSESNLTSDSDTDSDADADAVQHTPPSFSRRLRDRLPTLTVFQRNVLKCSVAYLIASLFTFVPYLSGFISDIVPNRSQEGPSPSAHMVATIAVYFNPAKSAGAMFEADIFCLLSLAFTASVTLSAMLSFEYFQARPGWEWLADSLVFMFIAVSIALVAWSKLWMAKASFNTACSMTAIILFVVLVKEGGFNVLTQVTFIVFLGSIIANGVCFFLWPQSATDNLQNDITRTLSSFSTLLEVLTRTFLLESDLHPKHQKLLRAVEAHQASFTSLKRNLQEARSEWCDNRIQRTSVAYGDTVDSLTRLAQHLGGLRSGTSLQHEIAQAIRKGMLPVAGSKRQKGSANSNKFLNSTKSPADLPLGGAPRESEADASLAAAAMIFGSLVEDVGPPMTALASTCARTLKRMRVTFLNSHTDKSKSKKKDYDFTELKADIQSALREFEKMSNISVMKIYRRDMTGESVDDAEIDQRDETLFLVYYFLFTLQEFAREMDTLVEAMSDIYHSERAVAASAGWLRWIKRRLIDKPIKKDSRFPRIRPHAPNTAHRPPLATLSWSGRMKQSFWALGTRLGEPDMKYAIKTGVATAMLASPAFIDQTRALFIELKGEWALISFFVVMSPTIGATNFLSLHRVAGTLFGAFAATVIYSCFPDNPTVLALFGFFFSMPCFYYIVGKPQYATSGRFVLLTYNLTCLYCYNQRHVDVAVITIALQRAAAVTVGVLWAFIVSRFWWPSEARRELSKALGEFCLNIGWLYTRLVRSYSVPPHRSTPTPLQHRVEAENMPLLAFALSVPADQLTASVNEFMAMELHLQLKLIELQGLLSQTIHEPRLKGPFPVQLYRTILTSLQTILDRLHSMRCVTTREECVRRDFIFPVNKERREMVGNVVLYFSTLASAFRLKAPLPPYLPPAEKSRQHLVAAIRQLDVVKKRQAEGSKQLLYFAYVLAMKGITTELDFLGRTLQDAFGVIGSGTEDFEALFTTSGEAGAVDIEDATN
ncbi:hypothetical protein BOTBODRAFT_167215 [Botryobasidium botryosum FD-172 SS1]|uniref:Uncharacterized protein n=1 Tax=Botryobasidium botryosum (strain FD-172 SS1) TaxID=930990 RepID=A0A067M5J6_BOTB1|nr:hypothetical protein BOTBODRAFT_167215 [Botryobasidium botryosum FD-172 SS1]